MAQSANPYQLEKPVWTDLDFENMGWHDSKLFALSFGNNYEFLFDIDYIFKWVQRGKTFRFWVSPCTLVFENVHDVEIQIDETAEGINIDEIRRDNPQRAKNTEFIKIVTEFDWTLDTQQGAIYFKSTGFKQYVRKNPKYMHGQYFELSERGGISFEKILL